MGPGQVVVQAPRAMLWMRARVQTAPPLPPFTPWAQELAQPPLGTPVQLSDAGAAASHVTNAGFPNCWITGWGADVSPDDEPPLPAAVKFTAPIVQEPPDGLKTSWPPFPLVTVKVLEPLFAITVPLPVAVVVPTMIDAPEVLVTAMTSPIPAEKELGDAVKGPLPAHVTVIDTGAAADGAASAMGTVSAPARMTTSPDRCMSASLGRGIFDDVEGG